MWKVYIMEDGEWKLVYRDRWSPTIDNGNVVAKVRGKLYKVISPRGEDCTRSFPYGTPT